MWHAAEEGLRSCGQPACHSVSADFHFGTRCPITEQETDRQRQTWAQAEIESAREKREKRGRVGERKREGAKSSWRFFARP